jgi:hypothetical protein
VGVQRSRPEAAPDEPVRAITQCWFWPQLDYYLDEFTFRFNRRGSNHRGLLFYRLLEQAITRGKRH